MGGTTPVNARGITATPKLRLTSSNRRSLQCLGQTVQHDCYIHDTGRNRYRLYNRKKHFTSLRRTDTFG